MLWDLLEVAHWEVVKMNIHNVWFYGEVSKNINLYIFDWKKKSLSIAVEYIEMF